MITDSIAFIQALIYSFYLKKKKKRSCLGGGFGEVCLNLVKLVLV